jgi:C-terminal processing protease CtpA/Prc
MNRVMNDLVEADRMVLDVRFNGGGQDAVSFEILRHFNEKRRIVGLQQVKSGDTLSPVQPLYLEASENPFLRPVYILTSPQTGSAAEAFALASLSLPHVKRIGAPTSGALSTALERRLPNGWYYSISNELFMDTAGAFYENRGVPADLNLPYPGGRQPFFRAVAEQPDRDKEQLVKAIEALEGERQAPTDLR